MNIVLTLTPEQLEDIDAAASYLDMRTFYESDDETEKLAESLRAIYEQGMNIKRETQE